MEKFRFKLFTTKVKDLLLSDLSQIVKDNNEPNSVSISQQIKTEVVNLETNQEIQDTISQAITEALINWGQQPEGNNSLVVLAPPVSPLTSILKDSLTDKEEHSLLQVQSLAWQTRLHNYPQIKTELLETVKQPEDKEKSDREVAIENRKVIVIPRLEWCFLRCIGGLEAIETLRDLVASDSSYFWLIGCNSWAWQYLENIYQISAYLNETVSLPTLDGTQIKTWLHPTVSGLKPFWAEDREWLKIRKKELKKAKRKHLEIDEVIKIQERYYDNLADLSQGIATVAGDLWWRSLIVREGKEGKISYEIQKAKPPELPTFIPTDRYVLYSLLLHGGMSLAHLAFSMGKNQSVVKTRTQFLLQAGVINKEQNILTVNPAYYPRLKSLLANNNFLVD